MGFDGCRASLLSLFGGHVGEIGPTTLLFSSSLATRLLAVDLAAITSATEKEIIVAPATFENLELLHVPAPVVTVAVDIHSENCDILSCDPRPRGKQESPGATGLSTHCAITDAFFSTTILPRGLPSSRPMVEGSSEVRVDHF